MDQTERKITKIAREAQRFTAKALKDTGIGPAEYEFIHCVRHNPGISQEGVRQRLGQDKAAIARRSANLEKKGYIRREPDPNDGRGKCLFATALAEEVKKSTVSVEAFFYEWLLDGTDGAQLETFLAVLDKLYWRSKNERRRDFSTLLELESARHGETED